MARPLHPLRVLVLTALASTFVALGAKPIEPSGVEKNASTSYRAADPATESTAGSAQFDTTLTPLPANVAGLGFASSATSEIGDLVRLGGTSHGIDRVTVTLSSAAARADFPGNPAGGFTLSVTLKIFAVDRSADAPRPGNLLAMVTQPFLVPWRPDAGAGVAFNATFDLTGATPPLPDEIIYSIGFSTQRYGDAPLGTASPADFVRVGLTDQASPIPGDVEPDAVFWKTAEASNYADGGASGVNVFRRDTGWAPHTPAVRFTTSAFGTLSATAVALRSLHSDDPKTESALREASSLAGDALNLKLWNGRHRLSAPVGFLIFELLSETADQLGELAQSHPELAPAARRAISGLIDTAESVTASAATDALRARGDLRRITRAKSAATGAGASESQQRYGEAIEQLGDAWRNLQLALP
jgi:hypothetical protein